MPKKPFSGKQKKKQLQDRRQRKQDHGIYDDDDEEDKVTSKKHSRDKADGEGDRLSQVDRLNQQPVFDKDFDPNRFRLHFFKISPEEMKRRMHASRQPIIKVKEKECEISIESVHGSDTTLDFPKRPPWNYNLSKEQLEKQEQAYFKKYVENLFSAHSLEELSYFELNLETWRQLWRVTEISDVLLLIADIRYPALHLPPSLYRYLRESLKREVILILNKVDLAPPGLVVAWRTYLQSIFPEAHVVLFTSFPSSRESATQSFIGLQKRKKRTRLKPLGPQELLNICKQLVGDKVDLNSWQRKLDIEDTDTSAPEKHGEGVDATSTSQSDNVDNFTPDMYKRFWNGILTIGCVGYPNVGKSSLLNGLVGKKVVSVSRTPGHTKHLQTIFLTPTVRLCDCPGLVFPSYVDKGLQILSGIYPIAQVREPYSAVGYLAQRIDLPALLRLPHPEDAGQPHLQRKASEHPWSSFDICEGWAIKNGFFTAKAARPDAYRAANHLLRMQVEGKVRLCLAPPNFFQDREIWDKDPFALKLSELMDKQAQDKAAATQSEEESSESESEFEKSSDSGEEGDTDEEESDNKVSYSTSNPFALLAGD